MNPFDLSASDLLVWGIVLHLLADWPLQNDWMANNKATNLLANAVHSGIHCAVLALVFGWAAVPLAVAHGLIDTRKPVVGWSRFVRQTQPSGEGYDVGLEVRFWTDQVFHIACIAIAALVVAA